jgi:hypothetical protein
MLGAIGTSGSTGYARAYEENTYQDGFTVMASDPQFRIWTNLMGEADTNILLAGESSLYAVGADQSRTATV